jgi:hypothetical protein
VRASDSVESSRIQFAAAFPQMVDVAVCELAEPAQQMIETAALAGRGELQSYWD